MKRALLGLVPGLLLPTLALADATVAVPADRIVPAIGPGLISVEAASTPAPKQVWWMVNLGWAHQPIVLRLPSADIVLHPVRDALTLHLGSELSLIRGFSLQALWPIVVYQAGDRLRGTGLDETPLAASVSGDFVLRLRAAFVGDATQPGLHLGSSLELTIPFDGRDHFAGRARSSFALRLHGDFRHRWFGIAALLGYRILSERMLFDTRFGDELLWGLGGVVTLYPGSRVRLAAVLEANGAASGSRAARPAELLGALRLFVGATGLSIDVGAGGGLDGQPTAARARLFVSIRGRAGGPAPIGW